MHNLPQLIFISWISDNMMRKLTIISLFCSCITAILAQNAQLQYNEQSLKYINQWIDERQVAFDKYDGLQDQIIRLSTPELTEKATHTYYNIIDSIQKTIEDYSSDNKNKYDLLMALYDRLLNIDNANYKYIDYYAPILTHSIALIKNKTSEDQLLTFLLKDRKLAIENINYFKELALADTFLVNALYDHPADVLKQFNNYYKQPYAQHIVDAAAKISPVTLKKYFTSKNYINSFILKSDDTIVKTIHEIYKKYGNETHMYILSDYLYTDSNSIGNTIYKLKYDPQQYLSALIDLSLRQDPIAIKDIQDELKIKSLEWVRDVNDMHDIQDSNIRFAPVNSMSAEQLYTLIVYSPEEIFTSTFNGLFERMLMRMQEKSGYQLLEQVRFNKFRTFIKLCSGYNALNKFLSTMSKEQAKTLFQRFIYTLATDEKGLEDAVNVADTFGSIDDTTYLNLFEEYLAKEYNNNQAFHREDKVKLYGLLLNILQQKIPLKENVDTTSLQKYAIIPVDYINVQDLVSTGDTIYQMHFFFDDEDGEVSYQHFIKEFQSKGWQISGDSIITALVKKGKYTVIILCNIPKYEYEGQALLLEYFKSIQIVPSVVVHRGHSYYAMNTIRNIQNGTHIVYLGSCGAYHNIAEVIQRTDNVSIIASKQIGTYAVNNTLLERMSSTLATDDVLYWRTLWSQLDKTFASDADKTYSRFLDYVLPHKNMGAIFLSTYKRL
jgi:hypothetical protein